MPLHISNRKLEAGDTCGIGLLPALPINPCQDAKR